jgi:hypothetical protein
MFLLGITFGFLVPEFLFSSIFLSPETSFPMSSVVAGNFSLFDFLSSSLGQLFLSPQNQVLITAICLGLSFPLIVLWRFEVPDGILFTLGVVFFFSAMLQPNHLSWVCYLMIFSLVFARRHRLLESLTVYFVSSAIIGLIIFGILYGHGSTPGAFASTYRFLIPGPHSMVGSTEFVKFLTSPLLWQSSGTIVGALLVSWFWLRADPKTSARPFLKPRRIRQCETVKCRRLPLLSIVGLSVFFIVYPFINIWIIQSSLDETNSDGRLFPQYRNHTIGPSKLYKITSFDGESIRISSRLFSGFSFVSIFDRNGTLLTSHYTNTGDLSGFAADHRYDGMSASDFSFEGLEFFVLANWPTKDIWQKTLRYGLEKNAGEKLTLIGLGWVSEFDSRHAHFRGRILPEDIQLISQPTPSKITIIELFFAYILVFVLGGILVGFLCVRRASKEAIG